MTDILCRWLNEDVELSVDVDKENVSKVFASGFYFGEILFKYGLQEDFSLFSKGRTADSKLNNFTRIEPTIKLLEIPYDTNTAKTIMNENHGASIKLLYQLFIALGRKAKKNLTGVAMETMRPSAPVKLETIESVIHKERLKQLVPRQVDVNFETLVERYHSKQRQQEELALKARLEDEQKLKQYQQDIRQRGLEQARLTRGKQNEIMQRIRDTQVKIPKPPVIKKFGKTKEETLKDLEIQEVKDHIDRFESNMKINYTPSSPVDFSSEIEPYDDNLEARFKKPLKPITLKTSGDDYVLKIKRKLNEDAVARKEREKRRRRVLVEQLKAHEAQEEQRREETLVKRLMRQSQQEKRIAVQLMQIRHEKQVIKENRVFREKQYAERRLKDFEDALNREAEMCRLASIEYQEQTAKSKQLRARLLKEKRTEKYNKHYNICSQILCQIVDFSCKIGEYRELTERNVPDKLRREWRELFHAGLPLYPGETPEDMEKTKETIIEKEKKKIIDEADFMEYRNSVGEWQPIEQQQCLPQDNPILGHIVQRLYKIMFPPEEPPPPPEFPPFPVKACFLGKFFSGKTTILHKLIDENRVVRLCIDDLVRDAIAAHKTGETVTPDLIQSQIELIHSKDNVPEEMKENQDPNAVASSTSTKQSTESIDQKAVQGRKSDQNVVKPSVRSKLGAKSFGFLKKGKQISDEILVDVMVEAVRRVPSGTGWVMDGFPATVNQAQLLEKALTGYDPVKEVKPKEVKGKGKKSRIAPDPHPVQETPPAKSGIDIVILFDLPDEEVLKRAEGRTRNPTSDEVYHQEFNPPVYGSYTGLGKQEKVTSVTDPSNDREQVQQRIAGFDESWSKLEKWFNKFGILTKLDVSGEAEIVYENVSATLLDTIEKNWEASQKNSVTDVPESGKDEVTDASKVPQEEPPMPLNVTTSSGHEDVEETTSVKDTKGKIEPTSRRKSSAKEISKKSRSPSPETKKKGERKGSPKGTKKGNKPDSRPGSRKGSPTRSPSRRNSKMKSPSSSRTDVKRTKSASKTKAEIEVPVEVPVEPVVPSGPEPGSTDWVYIEQPIDTTLVSILSTRWENLESTYIETSKNVFGKIRNERELIYRYFYGTRKEFLSFLQRPDEKAEYVLQWQKYFNNIAEDTRNDDDVKAELHEQVDDLCDRLYEICDNRKEMAEKERLEVINEGWLEDRLGLLTNHYLTLMQVEVDRYQDTLRVLKDYYNASDGKHPTETQAEIYRLPLVDLPPTIPNVASSGSDVQNEMKQTSSRKDRENNKTPEVTSEGDDKQHRIPLVPRRPKSGDPLAKDKKDKRSSQKREKADNQSETPVLPSDLDERLIFDGYYFALGIIDSWAASDQTEQEEEAAKMAEALREKEREKEKEKEKELANKKGAKDKKDKKGKSASKTALTKPESPPPEIVNCEGENEEEMLKKELREKSRREYVGAVSFEDSSLRARLEMIRNRTVGVIQELKMKADLTYKDMDDWLGARYLQEVESIKVMAELARNAIENEEKLQSQIMLEDKLFVVDLGVNVFQTPSPPRPSSPKEYNLPDMFTVVQLEHIYNEFLQAAPSGFISCRAFVDLFLDLISTGHGLETLPDCWLNQTALQLHNLSLLISHDGEFIDWRKFIIFASYPLPLPSRIELSDTLAKFLEFDVEKTGFVTREEFFQVKLWFSDYDANNDTNYPRFLHLKELFFKIFEYGRENLPVLNYKKMLMYFCVDENPLEGFLRALTIECGQPMLDSTLLRTEKKEEQDNSSSFIEKDISKEPGADSQITVECLYNVFHHGEASFDDNHRFQGESDSNDLFSKERISGVYEEFGASIEEPLPFSVLYQHPIIQECIQMCQRFKYVNIQSLLKYEKPDTHEM